MGGGIMADVKQIPIFVKEGFKFADYKRGYEDGMQTEYDRFWDMVQNFGRRTDYVYAFTYWIVDGYIRPKHKVVPTTNTSRSNTFYRVNNQTYELTARVGKEHFDFSKCPRGTQNSQGWYYTFSGSKIDVIEDIGMNNAYSFCYTFAYSGVHTIECIYPDEDTLFINAFISCKDLVNLTINGVIGQNGLDLQWSTKLSYESITSIIAALSNTTTGLSITLPSTAKKTVNDYLGGNEIYWDMLVATKPNWTISLV
jgi:hypothetical protein